MNGKCLEVSSTNYIKMQDCTATTNQKWQFNSNNQIISEANSKCIEAQSGIVDGSLLIVNTCNTSNNNQKWNFADIVILTSGSTKINTRVNLAGPWNTTTKLMNKDLITNNKIPLLQPFCTAPWNYCGTENIHSRTNIDQSAVDWVLVEIKNTSGITVQRKAALITNDAFLTDANGINSPGNFYPVKFSNITSPGYYKIIVRHRNHLAIATDSNVYLTQSTSPSIYNDIDLTKNVNVKGANQKLLGTNSIGQNVYGLRVGDVNSDGYIDAQDRNIAILSQEYDVIYSLEDANLDSVIDATDRNIVLQATEASMIL
jgi:Ricin-type beta-trefoil lectin domain